MNKTSSKAVANLVVANYQANAFREIFDDMASENGSDFMPQNGHAPNNLEFGSANENILLDVFVKGLTASMEVRDSHTGHHNIRTRHYIRELSTAASEHPDFKNQLDESTILLLSLAATLHDIGKLAIPDSILLKPGKLNPSEFEIMKSHPMHGYRAILTHECFSGSHDAFLRHARDIAYCHHERWDGSGYPLGLKGNGIPLSARLMAIADVYDALISQRAYKAAITHEKAIALMSEGRGTQFDPRIFDTFIRVNESFAEIARCFSEAGSV